MPWVIHLTESKFMATSQGPYTRKLAVILHADVAGSTQLVRQDESLAPQRVQKTFQDLGSVVRKHNGRVIESRGGALLAELDLASDAVAGAIAFQSEQRNYVDSIEDEIRPIVRVGIATGEDGAYAYRSGVNFVIGQATLRDDMLCL